MKAYKTFPYIFTHTEVDLGNAKNLKQPCHSPFEAGAAGYTGQSDNNTLRRVQCLTQVLDSVVPGNLHISPRFNTSFDGKKFSLTGNRSCRAIFFDNTINSRTLTLGSLL
ncbi:hypothetical protein PoB_003166300 [Plakobranchus ocellatus]|uniref:Uncharacterized protein n=1 Tax=Plakobranchus ocellatus TaxID=259542 RepID=A0AAV4AF37_9GAST|nr:hypothetical protein PoB_003166300 [Plakobranchus ocellatus]